MKTILLDNDDRILLSSIVGVRLSSGMIPSKDGGPGLTISHTVIVDRANQSSANILFGADLESARTERDRVANAWCDSL